MNVLLVCHRYPPQGVAGVERISAQTAEGLAGRGHEVTVLTRLPSATPPTLALERERRNGVQVVSLVGGSDDSERFPSHGAVLEKIFERMLVELTPDAVLVTHLLYHSPGYVAVAHRWGIPVVLELHDFFALCPRAHLQRRSGEPCGGPEGGSACARHCFPGQPDADLRWALRSRSFAEAVCRADEVLAPSRFVADAFESRRGEGKPIRLVENAVPEFAPALQPGPSPCGPLHLASIGVTVEHKGFHIVIEALRRARLRASRYTVLGVPLQPQAGALHEAAEDVSGLELRLAGEFLPAHLPVLLADVDALVVPSLVPETFSIVAREGFACGLPVVASRIGALPDAIEPGESGWLFDPGDTTGLAELLQRLDGDRSSLMRASERLRAKRTTISVGARTGRIQGILEEAVERTSGRLPAHHGEELALMRRALGGARGDVPPPAASL